MSSNLENDMAIADVHLPFLATYGLVTALTLAAIYGVSAVFSGLSGFGFSAVGALSLCVVPPQLGICMLMLLSVFTQAMSIGSLRAEIRTHNAEWQKGFVPYAVGGVIGLPIGLAILTSAPTRALTCALGGLLVAYALFNAVKPASLRLASAETSGSAAVVVGAIGGVVGGFSAFPGSALVVWNGLKNVPKEQGRALTQPYIFVMQVVGLGLAALSSPALFDASMFALLVPALPLAWAGNRIGLAIYKRTSHVNYRLVTLGALGVSGASLVMKALFFR
jgi:uncharacterized membrane protein YfcA